MFLFSAFRFCLTKMNPDLQKANQDSSSNVRNKINFNLL
ncbi:hypothetical protein PHEL49_0731 [Polaribacter sp. Hel1_33_49]|nr:hypothetical protein PHEL49_0731 [Polaribacter sp. Hel1_33_49]